MLTHKIGKLLRGKVSTFQIVTACVFGSLLGFLPGPALAPGLYGLLFLLVLLINANLFLLGMVFLGTLLLGLLLRPILFQLGIFLLEGSTQGIFTAMINAPGLAWAGFESYLVTGGAVAGLAFGLVKGFSLAAFLRGLRRKLAALETGSEAFQKAAANPAVKFIAWLFFGGLQGKQTYQELLATAEKAPPIRLLGVVALLGLGVILGAGWFFLDDAVVTEFTRSRLQQAYGATVDLASLELDPAGGRAVLTGLALANPDQLTENLFSADRLEADLDLEGLLRRRLKVDRVAVDHALSGQPRAVPGERFLPPDPERKPWSITLPSAESATQTITNVLDHLPEWKRRLSQAREWLEKAREGMAHAPTNPMGQAAESYEALRDRLLREAAAQGYDKVLASHLVEGYPTLTLGSLEVASLQVQNLPGETFTLAAENLSTQPWLLPATPPQVRLTSASGRYRAEFSGGGLARPGEADLLSAEVREIPAAWVRAQVPSNVQFPVNSGLFDVAGEGRLTGSVLALPLAVTLHQAEVVLPVAGPTRVDRLSLPVSLAGPIDQLSLTIDSSSLQQVATGLARQKGEEILNREIEKKLGAPLDQAAQEKLEKQLGTKLPPEIGGALSKGLGGLLGGSQPKEEKPAENTPKP